MDKVNENHEPIIITRQNGAAAVLMSLENFNAWEETAYLLRSPTNAKRLDNAIAAIDGGNLKERALLKCVDADFNPDCPLEKFRE